MHKNAYAMNKKKWIGLFVVGLIIGVCTGLYVWKYVINKPHEKVEDAKGITITAMALAKEYSTNEKRSDSIYLNKAIEVSGVISEIDKNQDGGLMVVLKTDDPSAGVQCALRDTGATVTKDQNITIKGFCSGNGITGVSLTDCVIK